MDWQAYALDHSDERWGVGRNTVTNGIYKFERYNRTYKSQVGAELKAHFLNQIEKENHGNANRRTTH